MTTLPAPDTLEEALSPEWLTLALSPRFPGVRITGVVSGPIDSRVSTNAQFVVEGDLPDGLPAALCIKGYFGDSGRGARGAGVAEACFYRDVAATAGIRTLDCFYADVDAEGHGVVVTADVVARGGRFLDPKADRTPDDVAASLGELAALHAATWLRPQVAGAEWLAPRMAGVARPGAPEAVERSLTGPMGSGVPEEVRDAGRVVAAYLAVGRETAALDSWCVMHGDTHVGNLFLDGDGRPGFLDWQLVQRGAWYVDVGYHLASSLSVEDRRTRERDLLAHYLDRLAAGGVERPSDAAAAEGLRRGIAYGFFLWGITQKVKPEITTVLLQRLGTAAADHEVLALAG